MRAASISGGVLLAVIAALGAYVLTAPPLPY